MSHCISCHESMLPRLSWKDLFTPRAGETLCSFCAKELQPINHDTICSICSRPLKEKILACEDCLTWSRHPVYHSALHQNRSLYSYNPALKELIKRFKYDRDYEIALCFTLLLKETLANMPSYDLLTPIPLNDQRLKERTFNQSEALIKEAALAYEKILTRAGDAKTHQAKKGKRDRHMTMNPFQTTKQLNGKTVVIVDDLYTTGTTIRHAAFCLKEAGAEKVMSITVGR